MRREFQQAIHNVDHGETMRRLQESEQLLADTLEGNEQSVAYPALIVELKWNASAQGAIKQIHDRHYPEVLADYTGEILLIGVDHDKKTKKHTCKIELIKLG